MNWIEKVIGNKSHSETAPLRLKSGQRWILALDGLMTQASRPRPLSWQSVPVWSSAPDPLLIRRTSSAAGFTDTEDDQNKRGC
jgi:hypothetical protein